MKDKDNIIPPSKSKDIHRSKKEELLSQTRSEISSLNKKVRKLEDELHYSDKYMETLPIIAKKLKMDEKLVNESFKERKRDLVSLFNSVNASSKSSTQNLELAGIFSLAAIGTGFLGTLIDPMFYLVTFASSACALMGTGEAINERLTSKEKLEEIRQKVRKQLPGPSLTHLAI